MRIFALALLCVLAIDPAAAKDTGLIFVSNEKSNNIIVIDPNSSGGHDIKVGRRPRPHFVPTTPALRRLRRRRDVIMIHDVATVKVTGKLKTGLSPEAFVIDDAAAYLHLSEEGRRSPSSTWTTTILKEVPTGAEPGRAAQRRRQDPLRHPPEGRPVHEVDTASAAITRDVVVGLRPRRLQL
jgi:DNA-binding beta-propeller fold protein YncE